jgi:hypothetical protein
MSPDEACALFGKGYGGIYWDADKSQIREFPDEECGPQGLAMLYDAETAPSHGLLKKVCSLTGPTNRTSCGERGYFGYLDNFASPLMGLITDKCRYFFLTFEFPARPFSTQ